MMGLKRLAVSGLLVAFAGLGSAEEFTYEGKNADQWVEVLLKGEDGRKIDEAQVLDGGSAKARHALRKLGASAVPALVKALKGGNLGLTQRHEISRLLSDVEVQPDRLDKVVPLLQESDFEIRRAGVGILSRMLDNEKAVAALREALNDKDMAVVEAAEEALKPVAREGALRRARLEDLLVAAASRQKSGRLEEALALYRQAHALAPEGAMRGEIDSKIKLLEKGLKDQEDLERQRALNDRFAVWVGEARAAESSGDLDRARFYYRRALQVKPNDAEIKRSLEAIERRLGNG